MATKFLDYTGLAYLWQKIKTYFTTLLALKADDANVVHKISDEFITGVKVFHTNEPDLIKRNKVSRVVIRNDNLTKGTAPEHTIWSHLLFTDSSSNDYEATGSNVTNRIGALETSTSVSNINNISIAAYKYTSVASEQSDNAKLAVGYDSAGLEYATAPSTSSSRNNGTDIITRDWLNGSNSGVVHTTGDESISGLKYFGNEYTASPDTHPANKSSALYVNDVSLVKGVVPSTMARRFINLLFLDSTKRDVEHVGCLGGMSYRAPADGPTRADTDISIMCWKFVPEGDPDIRDNASITVGYDADGIKHATAPSTSSTRSNGTDIVTRDWIPNDTRVVHTTGDENIAGTKTFYNATNTIIDLPSKDTQPASRVDKDLITCTARDNNFVCDIYTTRRANGYQEVGIRAVRGGGSDITDAAYLQICSSFTGTNDYAACPTPSSASDNSNKIATTEWVRQATGNTNLLASEIQHKHVSLTKGTNPSALNWMRSWIIFEQTGEDLKNRISEIRSGVDPNGTVYYELLCYKYAVNSIDYASLRLVQEASGASYVNVPTPANDSNSNIAATTEWCRTNLVAITGDQTITGRKRFSSSEWHITLKNPDADITANPANPRYWNILFSDKNNAMAGRFLLYHTTNHTRGFTMVLCEEKSSSPINRNIIGGGFYDATHYHVGVGETNCTSFYPNIAGLTLGENSTTRRWGQIYSSSTSISTSDERAKTSVSSVPDAVLDAWDAVEWVQFQMKDSVAVKGTSARLHNGAIAQRISDAFSSAGLDASYYGLFCYDEWDSEPDSYDNDGNRISVGREAGNLYSLRYEEALCMEAAYQRRKNKILENRISELETQVQNMLQILESLKGA